jgi:lipid II:glycine glycyltransferase (peptidoglycan interpeptide bridge formation enzyme)
MVADGELLPKDKSEGLWGVYNFKRGFGGVVESYAGAYDYVYNRSLYGLVTSVLGRVSLERMSRWGEVLARKWNGN